MAEKSWIEKAIQRLTELTDIRTGRLFDRKFRAIARLDGSELKFRRFARASHIEELSDLNAELTFALLFVGLGFGVAFEPTGDKGPDLSICKDSQSAHVEVKRFRQGTTATPQKPATTDDPLIFRPYGQPEKDTDKVRSELYKKFRQVAGHDGILAVWCDDDDLDYLEHEFAVNDMRRDAESNLQRIPENVLFSIFAGNWHSCSTGQEVYCRPFRPLVEPFRTWADDLEAVSVSGCVGEALKKLSGPSA
jgi:hypothetical protein